MIYLSTDYKVIWLLEGEALTEMKKHMIQAENMIFTIV
jgi:hypothetical protein